ncbi:Clavaminate synthase-like protein [Gymnopus androsaceus JB14]|uniref:Clavaminate synthase-like protein n=1 Tax=Gymnopus androsaceus JB14 TaxID=1447944 RepID=A0A6A4ID36_9AGAR|nr:Clavaminate synthase-like protein [Gymnopus androsaceus JB14]
MAKGTSGSCWNRLYTDAAIIRSLASLDASTSRDAIARLDRAIIIAGAVGQGRLDLILSLIRRIQTEFLSSESLLTESRLSSAHCSLSPHLQTSSHDIPAIDPPSSFMTFVQSLRNRPFLLRKYATSWPAINEHPWSSTAYLRSVAGPARIVPVEVGADYRTDDWMQEFMDWDDFLSALEPTSHSTKVLYLAQHNLLMQFPDLNKDIVIPDYVYTCPPPPEDYPQYKPPGNDEQLVINGWLGPRGTISPAHTDPYYNFYVQIVGRKTVWLAPPSVNESMYAFVDGMDPNSTTKSNPASNATSPSMSNTSRVDVFTNPQEDDTTRSRFPEFWDYVVPEAMSATLEPGDMLFIPPGWWHAMRAEETSFSVSMWF